MPSDRRKAQPQQDAKQSAAQSKQSAGRPKQPAQRTPVRHRGHGPFGMDSEQSARLLLFGVTAAVVIAAAAFIAVGYYVAEIRPRGRTVLQVDEQKVSYSAMKRRVAHEYYTNPSYQNLQTVQLIPTLAYSSLVDELVLISRAESELQLVIDEEALNEEERVEIGVGPDADEATYSERYRAALSASRLHDSEFKRKIRATVIEEKAKEKLNSQTPSSVPMAKVEVIVVNELDVATQAVDRVRAGEDWKTVAGELSVEANAGETGGLKDYNFESALPEAYATFAFSAPIGDISEPLQDPSGSGPFYVVRLVDRSDQPLTEEQRPNYEARQYSQWLEETRAKATIIDKWTTDNEAQSSSVEALIQDAIDKAVAATEVALTPQPTLDPAILATAQANNTVSAQTQEATTPAAGTPAPTSDAPTPAATSPPGGATPVATPPANGQ